MTITTKHTPSPTQGMLPEPAELGLEAIGRNHNNTVNNDNTNNCDTTTTTTTNNNNNNDNKHNNNDDYNKASPRCPRCRTWRLFNIIPSFISCNHAFDKGFSVREILTTRIGCREMQAWEGTPLFIRPRAERCLVFGYRLGGSHQPWSCHTSCHTPVPFGRYDTQLGWHPRCIIVLFNIVIITTTTTGVCKINARSENTRYDSQPPFPQISMWTK